MKKEVLNVERRTSNVEQYYRVLSYLLINLHPLNAWHRSTLVHIYNENGGSHRLSNLAF